MYAERKTKDAPLQKKASDVQRDLSISSNDTSEPLSGESVSGFDHSQGEDLSPMYQRQVAMQFKSAPGNSAPSLDSRQSIQRKKNSTGLPDRLKTGIENLSGYSMDDVKVHYNSSKPAQLQAHAYAQGTDIHLGPGQERHLPHEAWHVVQQKQRRVRPTMQLKGKVEINANKDLEREADIMGEMSLQPQTFSDKDGQLSGDHSRRNSNGDAIQRKVIPEIDRDYHDSKLGKEHFDRSVLSDEDAFKDKTVIRKRVEEDLLRAYYVAVAYMFESPTAVRVYKVIHNYEKDLTIYIGAAATNAGNFTVNWNPWQLGVLTNFIVKTSNPELRTDQIMGVISSATLLFHELGHIKQDIEAEEFEKTLDKNPLEGVDPKHHHGFHSLLYRLHELVKKAIDRDSVIVNKDVHRDVMEPDNVTRHERPTAEDTAEPSRADYNMTAGLEHFPGFTDHKTFFDKWTERDSEFPDMQEVVTMSLVSAEEIGQPDINETSMISHLTELKALLEQEHPINVRTESAQDLVDYLRTAISFWERRYIEDRKSIGEIRSNFTNSLKGHFVD